MLITDCVPIYLWITIPTNALGYSVRTDRNRTPNPSSGKWVRGTHIDTTRFEWPSIGPTVQMID